MALNQTINVVKLPNDTAVTSAGSTGVVTGIQNQLIDTVTACSAAESAAYPGAVTKISVRYFRKNQQLTGSYLVTQSVATVVGNSGGVLQSLHVVQLPGGDTVPGFAGAGTVYGINSSLNESVLAATAAQIVTYPSALSQINRRYFSNSQQNTGTLIVTESVASVISGASSNGSSASGQVALVAGTKAITIPGLTTANLGFVTVAVANTPGSTVVYQAVCTANTLTLQANIAAGTINVADISTLNYFVI